MLSVSWYRSIRWFTKQVTTKHNKHSYMWSNVFCKKQVIFSSAATCINEHFICFYVYRFNFTWRVFKIYQVARVNAVLFEKQVSNRSIVRYFTSFLSVTLVIYMCVIYQMKGPDHGNCSCGKCLCTSEFSGASCDCQTSKESCRDHNGVGRWVNEYLICLHKKPNRTV